jgi:hypothetical protein
MALPRLKLQASPSHNAPPAMLLSLAAPSGQADRRPFLL